MGTNLGEELPEVGARELPLERTGDGFIVLLEAQEPLLELRQGAQVVWRQDLTLEDGEVDLDLIEPTGVHGRMNGNDAGPALAQALDAGIAAVRGAVVHDPKHALCRAIRLLAHDLMHEAAEGRDASLAFTTTKELGPVDIPGRQIRPGAAADIFMLDSHAASGCGCQCRVSPAAGLDAGLLVGGDHEVVFRQGLALPAALVQIQDSARLLLESGVAREDPTTMGPRADGILREPTPQARLADRSDDAPLDHCALELAHAPARQRYPLEVGQLASERLNGDDDVGGKTALGARFAVLPRAPRGVSRRSVCAIC